jgi:hypothetical protein
MNAKIIDGKAFAEGLRGRLATEVAALKAQPGLCSQQGQADQRGRHGILRA